MCQGWINFAQYIFKQCLIYFRIAHQGRADVDGSAALSGVPHT
jgi:hypothetical protein